MVGTPGLTEYRYKLDVAIAGVMPSQWEGHARMAAFEKTEELDDGATNFAVEVAHRLAKRKDAPPETIADAAAKKAREKFA